MDDGSDVCADIGVAIEVFQLMGMRMDTQDTFLPGTPQLWAIFLQNEGYSQTLLIGSEATFGGRRLYFDRTWSIMTSWITITRQDNGLDSGRL